MTWLSIKHFKRLIIKGLDNQAQIFVWLSKGLIIKPRSSIIKSINTPQKAWYVTLICTLSWSVIKESPITCVDDHPVFLSRKIRSAYFWFHEGVPAGVCGLRLLTHRFPIRIRGRLGLFPCFTTSHTPFPTFAQHQNTGKTSSCDNWQNTGKTSSCGNCWNKK